MSTTPTESWYAGRVLSLREDEILALYARLTPPDPQWLDGEFAGYPHAGPNEESARGVRDNVLNRDANGYWLGKSMGRYDGSRGEGYNRLLQRDGTIHRKERFHTRLGESLIDGQPTFLIEYRGFNNPLAAVDVVDEIRQLGDGTYLLMATNDDGKGGRSAPMVMFLEGPVGPFVGHDPESEEL